MNTTQDCIRQILANKDMLTQSGNFNIPDSPSEDERAREQQVKLSEREVKRERGNVNARSSGSTGRSKQQQQVAPISQECAAVLPWSVCV